MQIQNSKSQSMKVFVPELLEIDSVIIQNYILENL